MAESMPVLVAPEALSAQLRAPVVAAAIGRGLERAGVDVPPDLCPVSSGGRGTIEVLLPALGGRTGDGFALIEDGATALVELAASGREAGERMARAIDAGAKVVLVCAGEAGEPCARADAIEAFEDGGGRRGAAIVVLCGTRAAWAGPGDLPRLDPRDVPRSARGTRAAWGAAGDSLRRDPRDVPMTAAGGGLAGALWARYDAALVPGAAFVLEQLGFDGRMRGARALVVGEACLGRETLAGRVAGEAAVRARQAGVPCHAVVARNAADVLDARILDLQAIVEARTVAELEAAGERLAALL